MNSRNPSGRRRAGGLRRPWAGLLVAWCSRVWLAAAPGEAIDVRIPVYLDGQRAPAAAIRVEKVFQDFERRGFFRIGVLPLAVADGVSIELAQPERPEAVLAAAWAQLHRVGRGRPVEFRRVLVRAGPGREPVLRAEVMRATEPGQWQLSRGVVIATGTNTVRRPRATLWTTGPQSGWVRLEEHADIVLADCLAVPASISPQPRPTPSSP